MRVWTVKRKREKNVKWQQSHYHKAAAASAERYVHLVQTKKSHLQQIYFVKYIVFFFKYKKRKLHEWEINLIFLFTICFGARCANILKSKTVNCVNIIHLVKCNSQQDNENPTRSNTLFPSHEKHYRYIVINILYMWKWCFSLSLSLFAIGF